MRRRQDVGDFLSVHSRPVFNPAAAPVDTYVQPAVAPRSKSEALSSALSQLDDAFSPVLSKGIRQQAKRDVAKGEELFQKNRTDFAEAVRSGTIPIGSSPFVRRGYRESQLHVLGATYNVELKRALEHSNLSEVDNPAEVEQFVQAFNEKFREENNLAGLPEKEVNKVFTPMVVQANDSFRNRQAAANIQLVEERRFRAFEQELHMAVTQGRFSGPEGSASADARNLSEWLNSRAQEMYEEGIDYKLIEKSILQAVGGAAAQNGSVGMAGLLNNIEVAGMGVLGQSAAGRKTISAARRAATSRENALNRASAKEVTAAEKLEKRRLQSEAQAAAREGDFDRADALLSELNVLDPTAARAVDGFIRRYDGDADDLVEDGAYAATLAEVRDAGSTEEAQAAIDEAIVYRGLTPEAANQLEGIAERRNRDDPKGDPLAALENDDYLRRLGAGIKNSFPKPEPFLSASEVAAIQDGVAQAEADFEDSMILWMQQNQDEDGNYDRLEARKAAQQARAWALEVHVPSEDQGPSSSSDGVTDPEVPSWAN